MASSRMSLMRSVLMLLVSLTSVISDQDSGCSSPMYRTEPSGTIESEGYGVLQTYPNKLDCTWIIMAPDGKQIAFSYGDFDVEYHPDCGYDAVLIYDGDNLVQRSCGKSLPNGIRSESNILYVQFVTDSMVGKRGFIATYTFVEPPNVCKEGQYECKNGNCIDSAKQCNSKDDCGDNSDEQICISGLEGCGMQDPKYPVEPGNSRIVGGVEAAEHSWPWQARVLYKNWPLCGGTLIHPDYVVTAAHCLTNRDRKGSSWSVYLGKHKKAAESDELYVKVSEVIEYPDYNPQSTDGDIALLKLDKSVTFTDKIKPACLPSTVLQSAGTECYVTGFGETQGTGSENVLKQASVYTIGRDTCNSPQWYAGAISKNMFCAGYPHGEHDSCQGDSGGPVSCEVNGRYALEGVVSWGIGCALAQRPGVYTAVPNFVDWIKNEIGDSKLN